MGLSPGVSSTSALNNNHSPSRMPQPGHNAILPTPLWRIHTESNFHPLQVAAFRPTAKAAPSATSGNLSQRTPLSHQGSTATKTKGKAQRTSQHSSEPRKGCIEASPMRDQLFLIIPQLYTTGAHSKTYCCPGNPSRAVRGVFNRHTTRKVLPLP